MIFAVHGHAPPSSHVGTVSRRSNHPHSRGNGDCTGDLRFPPVSEDFVPPQGASIQVIFLDGTIDLLLSQELDEKQDSGAQGVTRVSNEGQQSEALVGIGLVVL